MVHRHAGGDALEPQGGGPARQELEHGGVRLGPPAGDLGQTAAVGLVVVDEVAEQAPGGWGPVHYAGHPGHAEPGAHGEALPPTAAHHRGGASDVGGCVEPAHRGQVPRAHGPRLQRRDGSPGFSRGQGQAVLRHAGGEADAVVEVLDAEEEGGLVAFVGHQLLRPPKDADRQASPAMGGVGADAGDAPGADHGGADAHAPVGDPQPRDRPALVEDLHLPARPAVPLHPGLGVAHPPGQGA